MKVLLLFTDLDSFHRVPYNIGLATISGYLKENGHEVVVKYIQFKSQYKELTKFVEEFQPDLIGFSSVETQFVYVMEIGRLIKKVYNCPIICGGVFVTLFPECVKRAKDCLDGIIRGEGEYAIIELLNKLKKGEDYKSTKNFCYYDATKDQVIKNPLNPLIDNLDNLPFPDRSAFDYQGIIDAKGAIYFHFTRGCPYNCAYCSNHALGRVYGFKRNKVRFRSPESCISEIKYVLSSYDCKTRITKKNYWRFWAWKKFILIEDDLFTSNKKWLYKFLDLYKKEINMPFYCLSRVNLADDEMFKRLKEAGCTWVMMSIESGNEFIRNDIMRRGMSNEQIYKAFQLAHENGLKTNASCIIGLPFETPEMIEDTIRVVAKTNTTAFGVNIFFPYSGTDLKRICEENGFLPDNYDQYEVSERRESILNLPTITKDELLQYRENWEYLVWKKRPLSIRKMKYILFWKNSKKLFYKMYSLWNTRRNN